MGLDNGIIIRNIDRNQIPSFIKIFNDYDDEIEIAYWRKCYTIRNEIKKVIHASENDAEIKLEKADVFAIIRALEPFFSKEYWDNTDSIWSFEDYFDNNLINIINLKWLGDYMDEHPETECYFYDSF